MNNETIVVEVEMKAMKKPHTCNGYSMIEDQLNYIPEWCDGTIQSSQPYISIHINDNGIKYNFHDCERCHKYIKTYKLDLIEA